jgi:hypothetical protein
LACCHVAVKTIANLRALPIPGTLRSAAVRGYHAAEDGGGGLFAWDASSPEADDGGLVIAPAGAPPTGRWKRVYHGPVLLQWFGLTPNTDVGPALQTLFTSFGNGQGGHFKLMPGTYFSSVPLRLADPGHQVWDFSGVTLRFDANVSGVLFELGDSSGAQNYVFDTLVHAPEVIHEHASETDVSARGSAEETESKSTHLIGTATKTRSSR